MKLYSKVVGFANPWREGDETVEVSAPTQEDRIKARILLSNTQIKKINDRTFFADDLYTLI